MRDESNMLIASVRPEIQGILAPLSYDVAEMVSDLKTPAVASKHRPAFFSANVDCSINAAREASEYDNATVLLAFAEKHPQSLLLRTRYLTSLSNDLRYGLIPAASGAGHPTFLQSCDEFLTEHVNRAVRCILVRWIKPFLDLSAATRTMGTRNYAVRHIAVLEAVTQFTKKG